MARRTLTSPKTWTAGAAAGALVGLVLLFGPGPDTAAHTGHTETVWKFEWRPGTVVYEWHHRNWYRTSRCFRYNPHDGECEYWQATGDVVEPRAACATVPAWSATQPSGATCDLHRSWIDDGTKYDWDSHRTEKTTSAARCHLPGSGLQPASRSTNTAAPGGQATVYRSTNTKPSQYEGSNRHCGWWSARGSHDHATTTTTEATTTTAPDPANPVWSGSCSYNYTVGRSYSTTLPTHSHPDVTGYSYSGATPGGMAVTGSSSLTMGGSPTPISGTLAVSRGTITASITGGDDVTLACTFRVRPDDGGGTTTTTTRPPLVGGWNSRCEINLTLGRNYGTKAAYGDEMPIYAGADEDRDYHYYRGQRPRGIRMGRIREPDYPRGWLYMYGTPTESGVFKGRMTNRRAPDLPCVITVSAGTWQPDVCEFFTETGGSYDLAMPTLSGVVVDRYGSAGGGLPPGLVVDSNRVRGSPTAEGAWALTWAAYIAGVPSSSSPRITCTFHVEEPLPAGWSDHCDWTFTVGNSYTRILPVATGATRHTWSGDVPDGMRMRTVRTAGGVYAHQLSGTPTTEGISTGTLTPRNADDGVDPIDCSFEVLPGPGIAECSRTIPSDQIDAVRDAVEWRTDIPKSGAHSDIPGGDHLITTGDPGVGGGAPRVWPSWTSDADLTVTDTTGCVWEMTEIISAAHPLFIWYDDDKAPVSRVSPAMRTQWNAMTTAQRTEVEATGRRTLKRVGLGTPEDNKWLGGSCEPGDTPDTDCVWGLPFPGVWQWSLTIRYNSDEDPRYRDLTIASGTTRFWRFADQVRPEG